ncbi:MAG TPA: hypothetical protein ENJ54_04545 [Chloroflexi bacterium]|nr:hypothetical protein [Chloroflexota bacterium]
MKVSGRLFRSAPSKRRRTGKGQGREYQWQVINDPTPEQAFLGRLFRLIDIKRGVRVGTWEDGTRWRNIVTGTEIVIENGEMVRRCE